MSFKGDIYKARPDVYGKLSSTKAGKLAHQLDKILYDSVVGEVTPKDGMPTKKFYAPEKPYFRDCDDDTEDVLRNARDYLEALALSELIR